MNNTPANSRLKFGLGFIATFGALALLHYPLLRLPYFWDEAGYYIPAALDLLRHGLLVPQSTLTTGHTPLVSICLSLAWRFVGYAPLVTRLTMTAFAAGTLVALYALGRTLADRETAFWACVLLGLSPLFFAQSTMALLDLPVAFTTTIAVWALLRGRMCWFAVAASLTLLTKETAIVVVPVAVVFVWLYRKPTSRSTWLWLGVPFAILSAWTLYYHQVTGYLTGGSTYLQYNLYSTLKPGRILLSLSRRLYQVFVAGANWLLVAAALLGYRRLKAASKRNHEEGMMGSRKSFTGLRREFFFITALLGIAYIVMLSVVGGAVLTRYLLPMFPCFYLALVLLVDSMPRPVMRAAFVLVAAGFVASWFINPPYPFTYENNLSYADFIQLHEQAAEWLSAQPDHPRILTAWPATDELTRPELGYVKRPLPVVSVPGFAPPDFRNVPDGSFDILYLYSRKYDPPNNWLVRFAWLARLDGYTRPIHPGFVAFRYNLQLVAEFQRRGQWVRIYRKSSHTSPGAPIPF